MNLVNERVEHIMFGFGVITELKDHKIWVQFQDEIGTKVFLYPDAFEKYLKAENSTVENNVLEEWRRKQEQLELECKEKERIAAEIEDERVKLLPEKKKSRAKSMKK